MIMPIKVVCDCDILTARSKPSGELGGIGNSQEGESEDDGLHDDDSKNFKN
jgi:hypothetical protein